MNAFVDKTFAAGFIQLWKNPEFNTFTCGS